MDQKYWDQVYDEATRDRSISIHHAALIGRPLSPEFVQCDICGYMSRFNNGVIVQGEDTIWRCRKCRGDWDYA